MAKTSHIEVPVDEWNQYRTEFDSLVNELRQTNERIASNRSDTDFWKQEIQTLKESGLRVTDESRQLTRKIKDIIFGLNNFGART